MFTVPLWVDTLLSSPSCRSDEYWLLLDSGNFLIYCGLWDLRGGWSVSFAGELCLVRGIGLLVWVTLGTTTSFSSYCGALDGWHGLTDRGKVSASSSWTDTSPSFLVSRWRSDGYWRCCMHWFVHKEVWHVYMGVWTCLLAHFSELRLI